MLWLGVLLALLIVFGFLWHRGKTPYIHRAVHQQELRKFLEVLLYRGYDRGFICVQVPKDVRFLQFSKYIMNGQRVGLQLDFPLAPWSKDYYELLRTLLREKRILCEVEKTGQDGVTEFLVVDVKQDLSLAFDLTQLILQNLYGLDEDVRVELYFSGVSPRDERIGFS